MLAMPGVRQKFADRGVDPVGSRSGRAPEGADRRKADEGGQRVWREGRVGAASHPDPPFDTLDTKYLFACSPQRAAVDARSRAFTLLSHPREHAQIAKP
jgi:hypothetical protein